MKVSKYGEMYQLTLWPLLFPVNCYIFEEQHEITLIDTGMPASFKGIVDAIKNIGKPLTNIILTHAHGDHVGSLDKLKESFPEACFSISVRDSRLLKGDVSLNESEPQTPIKGGIPKGIITEPNRLLMEGDKIGSLEVVETPGHTPGSISLYAQKTGHIIVGDAFQTRGKIAVSGKIVKSFPFPAFATWNKEIAIQSAKKILELKPSLLAAGHGTIIQNPEKNIARAIIEAEEILLKR
ncbi:MBL fold metallo-hydrolase [Lysinibacillus telephonicus]|uniref:MBL fold metallo-hydrolase n=1 Tax=Lysinibacillus telephonicus TaxID=1714840 RepID=A0A3S0HJH0_9BACI|nr:MBL fold metallo-hydrolase [Lysinibacillus telephonicus]RTQ93528.1 MBL fold metallo-hydrolase [Lysinibacillus telephonicus]